MRHGETDWNIEKRLQGRTDIPLNENGIKLAEITSEEIFKNGITFDRIYTSPLVRAVKTAEIINKHSLVSIIPDDRIIEFCFGEAEGVTMSEIKTNDRYSFIRNWFLDGDNYRAEKGAESYEEFFSRLQNFLDNEIKPLENKVNNLLIVCHGGVVWGLLKQMLNWPVNTFASTKIPNCGLNLCTLTNGSYKLEYIAKTFAAGIDANYS